jgi:V/A-type H+-transporting ATPase subunit C
MAKSYNPTEYMYSSARIRALENKIATNDRLRHMADAQDSGAVISQLSDFGFETVAGGELLPRDRMLESVLVDGYAELAAMECAAAVDFMRYQYDANNIKAIIKCAARGVSVESMLSPLGSVSTESAKNAFKEKDYGVFSKNIAQAISEAEDAFAKTSNPQQIDFIIDRACFADMLDSARQSGVELAIKLVVAKIDILNIMIALRVMRMDLGNMAVPILSEAYIDGGSYQQNQIADAAKNGEEALAALIARGPYEAIASAMLGSASLGEIERIADDLWFAIAKTAKYVSFGAQIAIGYIVALEYEVKNIRIILAGKDAGLSADIIRERLRDCYA